MVGTLILTCAYQWLARVDKAPFGPSEVRWLLVARGIGGFFGVYGMYCRFALYYSALKGQPINIIFLKIHSNTFLYPTLQ